MVERVLPFSSAFRCWHDGHVIRYMFRQVRVGNICHTTLDICCRRNIGDDSLSRIVILII